MSEYPPPSAAPHHRLRVAALAAVIVGVMLLAAAAFALSYSAIHDIALEAGVAPALARLYPVIFDAMLVIAGAAALALRGAGIWMRAYVWLSLMILLAAVAASDAAHAVHLALPQQPTQAAVAVTPWVLLLLGFGFWLAMLRQIRRVRGAPVGRGAATAPGAAEPTPPGGLTWAGRPAQARSGLPGPLDSLLEPRPKPSPLPAADPENPFIVDDIFPFAQPSLGRGQAGVRATSAQGPKGAGTTPGTALPRRERALTARTQAVEAPKEPALTDRMPRPLAPPSADAGAADVPTVSTPPFDRVRSTPTPPRPADERVQPDSAQSASSLHDSGGPGPAAPDSAGPGPAGPDPAGPDPTGRDSADPGPAAPDPAAPDPAAPDPAGRDSAGPGPAAPDPAGPGPAGRDSADPDPAAPDPAGPDPAVPDLPQPMPPRPTPPQD